MVPSRGLHRRLGRAAIVALVVMLTLGAAGRRATGQSATEWVRYQHPTYRFTLSYPAGWEVLSGEGRAAFAAIGPQVAGVPGARLNIAVATARIPPEASLEEAEADLQRMLAQRGETMRLLRKDRISLQGIPAFIAYVARQNPQGAGLYQMLLVVAYKGRGYAVVGTTAAGSARLAEETHLLQLIVLTFRPR